MKEIFEREVGRLNDSHDLSFLKQGEDTLAK